jgi:hypothetical protein
MTTRALLCCLLSAFCLTCGLGACTAVKATPEEQFFDDDATDEDAGDDAGPDASGCVSVGCPCKTGSDCASKLCGIKGSQQVCVACIVSNGGVEKCDGLDNNCNGKVDESTCPGDGNCLLGECDGATHKCHMTPAPDNASCDDGNACTLADKCAASVCAGASNPCEDGNPCTSADCLPATGCLGLPLAITCDDDDACTFADACSETTCVGTVMDCKDSDACTDDMCSDGACMPMPNTATCDDGDGCTQSDVCANFKCAGLATCQDGDPCTLDACDSANKICTHAQKIGWQAPLCSQCAPGFTGAACDACSDLGKTWPSCQ